MDDRIKIICGHYGCGKTNLSLNLALAEREKGRGVTIVDLDIVNQYFRSSDYKELLEGNGIKLVCSKSAGTNVDSPALPAEIFAAFDGNDSVIIDVGGDDAGAIALGRFAPRVINEGYKMYYVINKYRKLIETPQLAAELLSEIEAACRLKACAVINNSHLCDLTTPQTIIDGASYAKQTAEYIGLPLIMTTAQRKFIPSLEGKVENLYPIDLYVKLPWKE